MASSNRKMLYPYYQPGQGYRFGFYIPWSQIYPPPPPPPPPPQRDLTGLFSTIIYITAAVLLFSFLAVFLYIYITNKPRRSSRAAVAPVSSTNRREDENEEEEEEEGRDHHHFWRITPPGLHRSVIDSITVVGFKKGEGIIDGADCSVCLSEFEEEEALRLLPKCSHAFHVSCIDMWLLSHKNCPLCRAPVFSTEVRDKRTETSHHRHQTESGTSNGDDEGEESSGSRNGSVLLPRSQSDLASRCGGSGGRLETVRRSFSIGGSSLVKDDVAGGSRRQFYYSSFSARFFSSSRRTRNQDSVLPTRMPSASG